jgi:S-adenosylmethionine:tRNA ribosyltransferase-isomerase
LERLSDYDYELPESAIAQRPLEDRAASRLLWLHRDSGAIGHRQFRECVQILRPGDLLVMNDTRVTALRLFGQKATGGAVEALLLREVEPDVYEALAKPGKRLPPGTPIEFEGDLRGTVRANLDGPRKLIAFESSTGVRTRLAEVGRVPLPPYIRATLDNPERYQTVYNRSGGSAAAPTAGLHFTREIFEELRANGVETASVTLDVGVDTFRPVETDTIADHKMHGERCTVPKETVEKVRECRGRIVAVGTTSARTLESFAVGEREIESGSRTTSIFIRPGYRFQVVEGMFTNFHMPRTTMLMMISALAGRDRIMEGYRQALGNGYRFLSFGDSMLIL